MNKDKKQTTNITGLSEGKDGLDSWRKYVLRGTTGLSEWDPTAEAIRAHMAAEAKRAAAAANTEDEEGLTR